MLRAIVGRARQPLLRVLVADTNQVVSRKTLTTAPIQYPKRLDGFTAPSVFAEFSPLAAKHNAVNMGQGFPNFATPTFAKSALSAATQEDFNQYTRSAGHLSLVNAEIGRAHV